MLKYPPRLHHHSRILQITRHPFSHQKHIEVNHEYPKNTVKLKCQMWTLCVGCSLKWVATYGSIDVESSKMVDKFWIMKKSSGVFVLLFYFPSIIFCTIFIGCFSLVIIQRGVKLKDRVFNNGRIRSGAGFMMLFYSNIIF